MSLKNWKNICLVFRCYIRIVMVVNALNYHKIKLSHFYLWLFCMFPILYIIHIYNYITLMLNFKVKTMVCYLKLLSNH